MARAYIENLDWRACIAKCDWPHKRFYCVLPYWGTEGYGVEFGLEQQAQMVDLSRSIKGKMIVRVKDIPEIREAQGVA